MAEITREILQQLGREHPHRFERLAVDALAEVVRRDARLRPSARVQPVDLPQGRTDGGYDAHLRGTFEHLSAFVNSDGGRRQMLRAGKTTSGLDTISTGNVKATRILLPPVEVHLGWEPFVVGHRNQVTTRHRQGDEADNLFASLLHRAFAGELGSHHAT